VANHFDLPFAFREYPNQIAYPAGQNNSSISTVCWKIVFGIRLRAIFAWADPMMFTLA
jgi:hypothetical protein